MMIKYIKPKTSGSLLSTNQYYTNNERGATLIIVLMVVLLLSLIGAISVRNSQVSLDMTTSSQVNQLLLQSSDVPLAKLEVASIETTAANANMTQLQEMAEENTGPIGLLKTEGRENAEYIMCYQPTVRDSLFQKGKHLILVGDGGSATTGDSNGYCRINESSENYYTSNRKTVATQVSMTRPTVNESIIDDITPKPFAASNRGTDMGSVGKSEAAYFRAYVTSVTPALAITSSLEDIQNCLKLPMGGLAENSTNKSQLRCLGVEDAPINIQVQDYAYNLNAR